MVGLEPFSFFFDPNCTHAMHYIVCLAVSCVSARQIKCDNCPIIVGHGLFFKDCQIRMNFNFLFRANFYWLSLLMLVVGCTSLEQAVEVGSLILFFGP